jgi:hypothetical protein
VWESKNWCWWKGVYILRDITQLQCHAQLIGLCTVLVHIQQHWCWCMVISFGLVGSSFLLSWLITVKLLLFFMFSMRMWTCDYFYLLIANINCFCIWMKWRSQFSILYILTWTNHNRNNILLVLECTSELIELLKFHSLQLYLCTFLCLKHI